VGVDLSGKALWTYSEKDNKNIQLSGGDVDLGQLPDVDIGGGNFITIEELAILVGQNSEAIDDLKDRVTQNETDISANSGLIASNTSAIAALDVRVEALEKWQEDMEQAIGNLVIGLDEMQKQIDLNTTGVGENADEIQKLWAEIGLVEGGVNYAGNYNAGTNLISTVSDYAASLDVEAGQTLASNVGDKQKGLFFIVTTPGTLQNSGGDGSQDNQECFVGDWLICDGTKYVLASYQMETVSFGQLAGDPYDNDALKAALEAKVSRDNDKIEGGTYSPARTYANRND
jgi:predicted Zn-dependent protease with MMP-like domain